MKQRMGKIGVLTFALIFISVLVVNAQTRGGVKGTLKDAQSGEVLMYANVALVGTTTGTVTDNDGNYQLLNVKPGTYTLIFSYLGYKDIEQAIEIRAGETKEIDGVLEVESIMGEEAVVTAMMRGQTAAINRQIKSNTIVNVVSREKISELPDANAAEAIGRLPGISIQRDAGEGSKVVVRGLAPKFNSITINGERIPSTDPLDRSVDLSMISPDMLEGMEVFKALRPDMDGDAIGGSVNFIARNADPGFHGSALLQTGYNAHEKDFGQYKTSASLGNRFFEDKFGALITGSFQRANRGSDLLDVGYVYKGISNDEAVIGVNNMNLIDRQETRYRGGASATLDYKLPKGKILFTSSFNQTDRVELRRRKRYRIGSWRTEYDTRDRDIKTSLLSNNLSGRHFVRSLEIFWRGSYSQSVQNTPFQQNAVFRELAAFNPDLEEDKGPEYIPAGAKNNLDATFFKENSFETSRSKDRNVTGLLDLKLPFSIGNRVNGYVKGGGKYRHKDRDRDMDRYWTSHFGLNEFAEAEPDLYDLTSEGKMAISSFLDPGTDLNPWLGGRYDFGPTLDQEEILDFGEQYRNYVLPGGDSLYIQDNRALLQVYSAKEEILAGYLMTEINIGSWAMIMPGVRYEYTTNNYSSLFGNPFNSEDGEGENIGGLTDTTGGQNYAEFLPMIHVRLKPLDWFDIRLAYTKTLSRPDYFNLVPWREIVRMDQNIEQGNPALKHVEAYNYDLFLSFYHNVGMFTAGFFYKEIDNIDYIRTNRIQDEGEYFGYSLTEPVNAEGTSIVKGLELELQTNFRYLPAPFDGIVLYLNYSRMFSQTEFPFFEIGERSPLPPFTPTIIDTVRIGRMPGQVDYVGNFSIGYEKRGFSGRVSLVIQGPSLQFVGTRPELDGFTDSYVRWDMVVRQKFGDHFSVYLNVNNLTNYSEGAFLGSANFPTREEYFGWSADVGVRYIF